MTDCLCLNGTQTRYEGGRGYVTLPCPICREDDFLSHMKDWKSAHGEVDIVDDAWEDMRELWKPVKPAPAAQQVNLFEQNGYAE